MAYPQKIPAKIGKHIKIVDKTSTPPQNIWAGAQADLSLRLAHMPL